MVLNDALPTSHRELKSVFPFIVTYIHEHNHNIKFVTFHFSPVLFPFTAEDFNLPRTIQTSIFLARIHEHFNIKFSTFHVSPVLVSLLHGRLQSSSHDADFNLLRATCIGKITVKFLLSSL